MYLDKLIIRSGTNIIRDISFHKGLNLIIDETGSKSTDSGNNIGKTTLLRVIDYCLGGSKDPIYTDKEFKRKNQKLYDFLFQKDVVFELNLKSRNNVLHKIVRPVDGKATIDGAEMSSEPKFSDAIQQILFGTSSGRPTLGQLMNKFIRVEDYQLSNTLYFLHTMADRSEYEALFMFLFGFRDTTLLGEKRKTVDKIKKYQKILDDSRQSVEDLEQQIHLINKELQDLEKIKAAKDFIKGVDVELENLRKIQADVSILKAVIAKQNIKFELSRESLKQLNESKAHLSVDAISLLYKQAEVELPNLKKKFEEVLSFHNQMVDNKTKFLERVIGDIGKNLDENRKVLEEKLKEESKLITIMESKNALGEYDKINLQLQDKSREKGIKEGLIQSLSSTSSDLLNAKDQLKDINLKIEEFERQFKENLRQFNEYFSELSAKLYGDKYYLISKRENNQTTDNYLLDIGNMNENIGTGKKKAQISALDLAYLKYSEEIPAQLPLFVLHDQLETVFENQIETLFEVANSINGQFIVAVLSDKLHKISKEQVTQNCILRLSQSDKLFKLP